jgi:hypothetical protein
VQRPRRVHVEAEAATNRCYGRAAVGALARCLHYMCTACGAHVRPSLVGLRFHWLLSGSDFIPAAGCSRCCLGRRLWLRSLGVLAGSLQFPLQILPRSALPLPASCSCVLWTSHDLLLVAVGRYS